MKILRYFILVLFVCSVFSSNVPAFAEDGRDYDLWLKEHKLLMLKQEIKALEQAKTDKEREQIIERFWEARDTDTFTLKNERYLSYEQNLIEVRKNYPILDDARRYIYLLYGKPDFRRPFADQVVLASNSLMDKVFRIRIGEGEIWKYNSNRGNFQVVFAKLSPYELQQAKDRHMDQESFPVSFSTSKFEILYVGPIRYTDVAGFIENFFREGIRLTTTTETINGLKKQILDRAKDFYKGTMPKVKKKKYPHAWKRGDIRVLIHPFEINSPEEVGISIWLSFNKDSLNLKKKRHVADLSLFCKIRDSNGKQIIHYQEDKIEYKLKKKKNYYYHFWGSLVPGTYKLTLEIGDNIGKKYKKFEVDVWTFDFSGPGLKACLLIGKMFKDSDDRFKEKPGHFSFKEGSFYPILGSQYLKDDDDDFNFKDDDDLMAIFNVAGFKKNNYGNPHVEFILSFAEGEIDTKGEFVPTGRVSSILILRLEEDGFRYLGVRKIKIGDLVKILILDSGVYKVSLVIQDKIAGKKGEGAREYIHPIRIISDIAAEKESINNSIRERKK